MVLNKGNLEEIITQWEVPSTPVKVLWHSKINQVRKYIDIFYRKVLTINDRS